MKTIAVKPARIASVTLIVAIAMCLLGPVPAVADVVTDWNLTAVTASLNSNVGGGGFIILAYVHAAIYDAVNAIDGRYTVYAVKPTLLNPAASQEAAAASAAYNLLKSVLPAQQALFDAAYTASLSGIPDGQDKNDGIAIGNEVAQGILALRANDGLGAVVPYTFGTGPGVYQATPPAFGLPVNRDWPFIRTFTLLSSSQFRPDGPPALDKKTWARDFNEVKSLGAANSTSRTPEQTQVGRFHTENPLIFWARNLRDFASTRTLSLADSARLFAALNLSIADASIAVFESKYHFNFWRPITAIAAADTDDNPLTDSEPAWTPLAVTPPHPEYPAAHGVVSGVVAETLRSFFRTKKLTLQLTSTVPNSGSPHIFTNTDQLLEEIIQARIYGGMHFRTSCEDGVKMGKEIARWIATNYFRPVDGSSESNGEEDCDE